MVDAIVVVLVSNGCLGHVGLFIPKVKLIQDVKVKMALMSKQYISYQNLLKIKNNDEVISTAKQL